MPSAHFEHLNNRCNSLIKKYADPFIKAEQLALDTEQPLPDVDIDDILALRLIAHAEFEYYFEEVARTCVESIRKQINSGQTFEQSALIFLYIQKRSLQLAWTETKGMDEQKAKATEISDYKNLLTSAIGFATDVIDKNNGIKENSIYLLGALSGRFPGEISETLITALDKYGSDRGEVAHKSWKFAKKANIESLSIEKNRIEGILKIIQAEFEGGN